MLLLTTEASGSNTDAQEHAINTLRNASMHFIPA